MESGTPVKSVKIALNIFELYKSESIRDYKYEACPSGEVPHRSSGMALM